MVSDQSTQGLSVKSEGTWGSGQRLGTDITTQRGLADDLEMAFNGCYPSIRQLDNSPMITHWKLSARHANCLAGVIFEHPILGSIVPNGPTSEVWLLDLDPNYARTFSRFYRLGDEYVVS